MELGWQKQGSMEAGELREYVYYIKNIIISD